MIFESCHYHRNGCFGAGYYHVRFRLRADGLIYECQAVVFDAKEHIAIFADRGETSFRYEEFEPELRAFVRSDAGQLLAFGYSRYAV